MCITPEIIFSYLETQFDGGPVYGNGSAALLLSAIKAHCKPEKLSKKEAKNMLRIVTKLLPIAIAAAAEGNTHEEAVSEGKRFLPLYAKLAIKAA